MRPPAASRIEVARDAYALFDRVQKQGEIVVEWQWVDNR